MRVYKVILTIIDFDDLGSEKIKEVIENTRYPNRCISPDVFEIETKDIGEWNDDNPLNMIETSKLEWIKLFPSLNR